MSFQLSAIRFRPEERKVHGVAVQTPVGSEFSLELSALPFALVDLAEG
jgi:hypothetical protein